MRSPQRLLARATLPLCALSALWACDGRMQLAQLDPASGAPTSPQPTPPKPGDPSSPKPPDGIVRPPGDLPPGAMDDVCQTINPGDSPLQRLTRQEYENSLRALLPGLALKEPELGEDEKIGPFFANTSTGVSQLMAEQYLTHAELVSQAAVADLPKVVPCAQTQDRSLGRIEAEGLQGTVGQRQTDSWLLWSNGHVETTVQVAQGAQHQIAIRAWGSQAGNELPKMRLSINGQEVRTFDVEVTRANPRVYTAAVRLEAGAHSLQVAFTNDFNDAANNADRNLWVDYIELTAVGLADGDLDCARSFISDFGKRAWRRPLSAPEQQRFEALFASVMQEQGFAQGIRAVIEAALQSPRFLYRLEAGQDQEQDQAVVALTGYELASRLSYFLWNEPPDDELLRAAQDGQLAQTQGVEAQARRMLQDPRARATLNDSFMELLGLANFSTLDKVPAELRQDLEQEARAFLDHVIWEGDGKLSTLLTAPYAFVSPRTASIYGVAAPTSGQLERVDMSGQPRAGLLTLPAVLARYGYGQRPVHRGLFLRETFFCARPAPPPDELVNPPETFDGQSMRSQAQGRLEHAGCGGCHAMMDPLGLAFDPFDSTGKWVNKDEWGNDVHAQGGILATLRSNTQVDGPVAMAQALAASPEVNACFKVQWLRHALGRDVSSRQDACSLHMIDQAMQRAQDQDHILELLVALTTTDAFRYRRPYTPDAP